MMASASQKSTDKRKRFNRLTFKVKPITGRSPVKEATMRTKTVSSLSLRDLEYAVAVGRERHFGRAADRYASSKAC
jgi:hypothetical protein